LVGIDALVEGGGFSVEMLMAEEGGEGNHGGIVGAVLA